MTEELALIDEYPSEENVVNPALNGITIQVLSLDEAATPDNTPPVIGNFVPAQGTILDEQQSVSFDVTDNSGLFSTIILHAVYADGIEEVVHDGTNFRGLYQTSSSRVIITDGWRYTVLRTGGWPSSPVTIRAFAVDGEGNLTEA